MLLGGPGEYVPQFPYGYGSVLVKKMLMSCSCIGIHCHAYVN